MHATYRRTLEEGWIINANKRRADTRVTVPIVVNHGTVGYYSAPAQGADVRCWG
jgi:hypothetical protein